MKILSVIIPIYNTDKEYFKKCLDSLKCVQKDEVEIIVIDDGSDYNYSSDTLETINDSILDVSYYKKENGGQNSAREYGLRLAKADYIFFMDADDYVDTKSLDKIITILKVNNPKVLAFNYDVMSPNGDLLEQHIRWNSEYEQMDIHEGLLYSDSLCLQIYSKEALVASGIHLVQGVKIGEDFASATAILSALDNAFTTNMILYHYIRRPGSTLLNPPKESSLDILKAFDKMLEQVKADTLARYHNEFEWLAILHVLYYGSERILGSFNGDKKTLRIIYEWTNSKFPEWKNNSYLKTEQISNTLPFILIINGHAILLKNLRILKRKLLRK